MLDIQEKEFEKVQHHALLAQPEKISCIECILNIFNNLTVWLLEVGDISILQYVYIT